MLEQNKKMNQSGEVIIVVHTERVAVEDSFLLMKFFPLSSHLARMLAVGNGISTKSERGSVGSEKKGDLVYLTFCFHLCHLLLTVI